MTQKKLILFEIPFSEYMEYHQKYLADEKLWIPFFIFYFFAKEESLS